MVKRSASNVDTLTMVQLVLTVKQKRNFNDSNGLQKTNQAQT